MQDGWYNHTRKAATIWYSNDPKSLRRYNTVNLGSWKRPVTSSSYCINSMHWILCQHLPNILHLPPKVSSSFLWPLDEPEAVPCSNFGDGTIGSFNIFKCFMHNILNRVRTCLGIFFFVVFCCFSDLLFCPFPLQLASFSMVFATFWCLNFSCWMVFCD